MTQKVSNILAQLDITPFSNSRFFFSSTHITFYSSILFYYLFYFSMHIILITSFDYLFYSSIFMWQFFNGKLQNPFLLYNLNSYIFISFQLHIAFDNFISFYPPFLSSIQLCGSFFNGKLQNQKYIFILFFHFSIFIFVIFSFLQRYSQHFLFSLSIILWQFLDGKLQNPNFLLVVCCYGKHTRETLLIIGSLVNGGPSQLQIIKWLFSQWRKHQSRFYYLRCMLEFLTFPCQKTCIFRSRVVVQCRC